MARILVITRAWPYPPGEQFVGEEARSWQHDGLQFVVMPWWANGDPAAVPAGVAVDLSLARRSRLSDLRALAELVTVPEVRAEVAALLRGGRPSRAEVLDLVRVARGAVVTRDVLRSWIRRNGPIDLVYSYWFDSWTLGALLLKGRGVGHVASRVHGYDLFEDRHPTGRHAVRRRLVDRLDLLLPVAQGGGEYFAATYGLDASRVQHAPLGVDVPPRAASASAAGELRVLSVASCLAVKRLDRLADAVALLAGEHPDLRVHWTHLGGGPLLDDLRARVSAAPHDNLAVDLPGQVSNQQVRGFLLANPVDVFVNTSESEGVPVAVMEAMAAGVPALGPDVGSMSEIVEGDLLLSSAPEAREVADTLWRLHDAVKQPELRTRVREAVSSRYERGTNHAHLVETLARLAMS